ncbi:MAG: DNA-3-methyladenine glycosylase family protein [Candidatus Bathyarchaeia archaeon]
MNLKEAFSAEFKPIPPYNFELTMRKPAGWWWSTPDEVFESGVCWTLTRFNSELLGLKIWSTGTARKPQIQCIVYSKIDVAASEKQGIKCMLERALKTEEDLCEFYALAEKDDILGGVVKDLCGMHTVGWPELFPALILAVTLQMAPMKRSNQMMDFLITEFGDKASFEGKTMRYWPSTKTIAEVSAEELMSKAKLGYRAKNLKAIAETLNQGFPSIDELSLMPPEDARKALLTLRGIGDYSAELVMPRMGFPLDVWSAKIFNVLFEGKKPSEPREVIPALRKIAENRWNGWVGHAFVYILNDLPKLSERFGIDFTKF